MPAKPTWIAECTAPDGLTEDKATWPVEINDFVDGQLQELSLLNGIAVNVAKTEIVDGVLRVTIEAVE